MNHFCKQFNLTIVVPLIFIVLISVARYFEGHLLFHSLAEFFTISVSLTMAVVSYYTYSFTKNNFLLYLGIGYFWVATLDFFHMLTYTGVMVYQIDNANITLTFWIVSRFFEAVILITATYINFSIISKMKFFLLYGFASICIYLLAFSPYAPELFIEGFGLTPLKVLSEYLIIFLLIVALFIYKKQKNILDSSLYRYMIFSILFTISAEFSFTLYIDMYGLSSMIGHIFKFLSYWMIFLAIVQTSLQKPFIFMSQESSTYNAIPMPCIVVDQNGTIYQINSATENFLHLSKDEIIRHSNHKLFHDESINESECKVCRTIQEGGELSSYELNRGSKTYSFTISSVNLANESTGAVQICIDITKDKLAQNELKILQKAIEQVPVSIVITDVEGKIEFVNPHFSRVTGYSQKEAVGLNPNILSSGHTTKDEYEGLYNTITHSSTWRGIFKNIKKNGEEYWETAIISPIIDKNGDITNYIGVKQDISEKVAMESLLQEQEEMMIVQSRHAAMGEMIGMIAHQWRQPLSVISMGANNMLLDLEIGNINISEIKDESNTIIEQVNHLSQTIEDFRNFFRPDKEKEMVDIKDIVDKTLKIIGKTLEHSNIKINLSLSSTSTITIYKRELIQVLINIINNAKEAMNENNKGEKQLFITTKEDANSITIEICDNGGGIEQNIINKIFEPYFSTKDKLTGTGLGLYMSKTIVTKHLNGEIRAKNSEIGGVCLIITLHKESKHD